MLQRGHSCDGCDLASTLCKYDLRKGDLFVLSWARSATSKARKYLYRDANVWCRCVFCYCFSLMFRDNRCLCMANVCFYICCGEMGWGLCECLLCSGCC